VRGSISWAADNAGQSRATQATFSRKRPTARFIDLILGRRPDLKEWLESIDVFGIFDTSPLTDAR
jgi:hypothetical protein